MDIDRIDLLDTYRLLSGAVVDLREVPVPVRLCLSDLALRLAQGQGYAELVRYVMAPDAPVYEGMSPLAPGVQERPAVKVARDLVYRAGVAEGSIEPAPTDGERAPLPRTLRTQRDVAGNPTAVDGPDDRLTRVEIVTVGEAMDLLGITRQAVINAVRAGKVKGEQHGRLWILSKDDVLRYRAQREERANAKRR